MAEPSASPDEAAGVVEAASAPQVPLGEEEEAPAEVYFWDNADPTTDVSLGTKAWDWTRWTGTKVFTGLEFGGEVVATFLGLTRSKYDWILETKERDDQERALRQLEKRQRKQLRLMEMLAEEKRKLRELEDGAIVSQHATSDILL